jgi:hypothetical protein
MRDDEGTCTRRIPEDRGPGALLHDSACAHHHDTVRDLVDDGKMVSHEAYGGNMVRRVMPTGPGAVVRGDFH